MTHQEYLNRCFGVGMNKALPDEPTYLSDPNRYASVVRKEEKDMALRKFRATVMPDSFCANCECGAMVRNAGDTCGLCQYATRLTPDRFAAFDSAPGEM